MVPQCSSLRTTSAASGRWSRRREKYCRPMSSTRSETCSAPRVLLTPAATATVSRARNSDLYLKKNNQYMNRKNYYRILGSFLYVDLYILLFCSYTLIVSLFLAGEPIMRYLSVIYRVLTIVLLVCCLLQKDGKCNKYLRNGNGREWDISKNVHFSCLLLELVFMANPLLFELFKILACVTGFIFLIIQVWYIKTGRIS